MSINLIKIMLVDDHNLVREGIKRILESERDFKIIAEAVDGIDAVKKAISYKPDIILMDINMPNSSGLEALRKIEDLGLKVKVIILTSEFKREYIIDAIKIGAKGFLQKNCTSNNLIKAIRDVYMGRSYLQPSLANVLSQSIKENTLESLAFNKIDLLTKREYEILELIASGYNNKEIGQILFISEKTVKNHITQVFKKLDVKDRVQAAHFAYNNSIKHTKSL